MSAELIELSNALAQATERAAESAVAIHTEARGSSSGVVWRAGVIVTALGWLLHPVTPDQVPTLLYLGIGTQIGALLPIRWKAGMQTVSDPLLVATGLFAPGGGVGIVAWLALFDGRVRGRGLAWWAFGMLLALTYFVIVYRMFRGKVTLEGGGYGH